MVDKKLAVILDNSTSGSTEIVLRLNSYFSKNVKNIDELKGLIPIIRSKLHDFAAVGNYLNRIQTFLEENDFMGFVDLTNKFSSEYLNKFYNLYLNAKPFLENITSVITISNSNTLLEVFKLWGSESNDLTITVTESSPKKEGRIFAKNLLKNNIKVRFITDAMAGIYVQNSNAVIIGADRILPNGDVINKAGSTLLALAAKHYNKPFYVIGSKEKTEDLDNYKPELNPAKEVWRYEHQKLEVINRYFEIIESKLITRIITD